jgi:hypothetical protein
VGPCAPAAVTAFLLHRARPLCDGPTLSLPPPGRALLGSTASRC